MFQQPTATIDFLRTREELAPQFHELNNEAHETYEAFLKQTEKKEKRFSVLEEKDIAYVGNFQNSVISLYYDPRVKDASVESQTIGYPTPIRFFRGVDRNNKESWFAFIELEDSENPHGRFVPIPEETEFILRSTELSQTCDEDVAISLRIDPESKALMIENKGKSGLRLFSQAEEVRTIRRHEKLLKIHRENEEIRTKIPVRFTGEVDSEEGLDQIDFQLELETIRGQREVYSNETLRINRKINQGGEGNTYLVSSQDGNRKYVLKEIFSKELNYEGDALIAVRGLNSFPEFIGDVTETTNDRVGLSGLKRSTFVLESFEDMLNLEEIMMKEGEPVVFSELEIIRMMKPFLLDLGEAHARHVIHRDLQPSNLLIMKKQEQPLGAAAVEYMMKAIDFGIADVKGYSVGLRGTPGYASPEQYKERCDGRADFYTLGIIIAYCLTKTELERIFVDNNDFHVENLPAVKNRGELSQIILHLTKFDREERPGTVKEIIQELEVAERSILLKEKRKFLEKNISQVGVTEFRDFCRQTTQLSKSSDKKLALAVNSFASVMEKVLAIHTSKQATSLQQVMNNDLQEIATNTLLNLVDIVLETPIVIDKSMLQEDTFEERRKVFAAQKLFRATYLLNAVKGLKKYNPTMKFSDETLEELCRKFFTEEHIQNELRSLNAQI